MSRGTIGLGVSVVVVSVVVAVLDDRVVDGVIVRDSVDIAECVVEGKTEVAVAAVLLFNTQVPKLQEYPNGQHASPHFGSSSSSRVVLRGFFWNCEGSWRSTLQVTGLRYEQSLPSGQHMAELSSSKLIQVLDLGQQKLEGRLELPHLLYELGHVSDSRGHMFNALLDGIFAARRVNRRKIEGWPPIRLEMLAFAMIGV